MGEELCQHQGRPYPDGWEQHWRQWGYSELPGELPSELRTLIHNHYKRVMAKLYDILWEFHQRDQHRFKQCLSPLLGFTAALTQIQVHHRGHQLHSISVLNQDSLSQLLDSMEWSPQSSEKGLFHIDFAQHRFQLRLKPMNKFTAPALKVNCSLKLQG